MWVKYYGDARDTAKRRPRLDKGKPKNQTSLQGKLKLSKWVKRRRAEVNELVATKTASCLAHKRGAGRSGRQRRLDTKIIRRSATSKIASAWCGSWKPWTRSTPLRRSTLPERRRPYDCGGSTRRTSWRATRPQKERDDGQKRCRGSAGHQGMQRVRGAGVRHRRRASVQACAEDALAAARARQVACACLRGGQLGSTWPARPVVLHVGWWIDLRRQVHRCWWSFWRINRLESRHSEQEANLVLTGIRGEASRGAQDHHVQSPVAFE